MPNKRNLQSAKNKQDDEWYTYIEDIEAELINYKSQLEDKTIYCNCDDPYESNFFKHLVLKFNDYKLKKLIAIGYAGSRIAGKQLHFEDIVGLKNEKTLTKKKAFKVEINKIEDLNKDGAISLSDINLLLRENPHVVTPLKGDGDFRSKECIDILKTVDIVITNPPFSLLTEYILQLIEYRKKFLILGPSLLLTGQKIFPFFQKKQIWRGYGKTEKFYKPNGNPKPSIAKWYTNLKVNIIKPKLNLVQKYDPEKYPKYLNYDAIDCQKIKDIPVDYPEKIGVSINIFDWNYEEEFDLIGKDRLLEKSPLTIIVKSNGQMHNKGTRAASLYIKCNADVSTCINKATGEDCKETFARFIIKRKIKQRKK